MTRCPTCHREGWVGPCPTEPPEGTRVRDRHGAEWVRIGDGWAPGSGFFPVAKWAPMWEARGPLIVVDDR